MNVSLQVFVSNMLVQVCAHTKTFRMSFHAVSWYLFGSRLRSDKNTESRHDLFFYLSYSARELVTYSWFCSCLLGRLLAIKVGMAARHKQMTEDSRLRSINGWDILIPCLPYSAWRMLMAFLQLDCAFSHCVVPAFHHDGHITVRIVRREPSYVRNLMLELRE